jgi:hypothetical protein
MLWVFGIIFVLAMTFCPVAEKAVLTLLGIVLALVVGWLIFDSIWAGVVGAVMFGLRALLD